MKERNSVVATCRPGRIGAYAIVVTLLVAALAPGAVFGITAAPVTVGAAGPFAVLAGVTSTASVTSTPDVTIFGDMGSGSTPVLPNFVCGTLYTQTPPPIPAALTNAYADALSVRAQLGSPPQPAPAVLTSDLGGLTLTPGVYAFGTTAGMAAATTLTFDAQGNPDAIFIIQVGTSLAVTGNANMVLANGARACNVYWLVGTSATIAGSVNFVGTISAGTSITVAALATVDGRLWAGNDVTLASDATVKAPCVMTVTKTANVAGAKVGDVITYTVTITNNSPCGPMGITSVADTLAGDITADFPAQVAASSSVSGEYTYTVQAGDPNPLPNLVTVSTAYTGGSPATTVTLSGAAAASVPLVSGGLAVAKSADKTIAQPGDTVTYTITLTNTESVALNSLTVTDTLLGTLTGFGTSLAAGATETKTFTYVVQPSDPNPLVNTVTATAIPQGLTTPISSTASASVPIVYPGLQVTKTANVSTAKPGDVITYTITLKNTGTVQLDGVAASDLLLGGTLAGYPTSLAPGASASNTFTYTVLAGGPNPLVNTASASGIPQGLTAPISASASASVPIVYPGLAVTKTANVSTAKPGDVITYTVTITNTGTDPLNSVSVIDPVLGGALAGFPASLAAGASVAKTFTYTVLPTDPNPLVNTVTFYATPQGLTTPISATTSVSVAIAHPGLLVTKTANVSKAEPGDVITYTITITNTGTDQLNCITVSDPLLSCMLTGFPCSLAPGASATATFTYVVPPNAPTPLVNTVTFTATPQGLTPQSTCASASVRIVHPSLCVTKTANTKIAYMGSTVTYTVTIKNTGDVTLIDLTAMDTLMGALAVPYDLAPGASACNTYAYIVKCSDANPLVNTVCVQAQPCGCNDKAVTASARADVIKAPNPPVANFCAVPTLGPAPLTVTFIDQSTGSPTAWAWNMGDGGNVSSRNPKYTYRKAGIYTVALTVSNAGGSDTCSKANYITVSGNFTASSATLDSGTNKTNDYTKTQSADGVCWVVTAAKVGSYYQDQETYTMNTGMSSLSAVTISVKGLVSTGTQTEKIYLYNHFTSAYDLVQTATLTATNTQSTQTVSSAAKYMSGGTVKVRIYVGGMGMTSYTHSTDYVSINCTP